MVGVGAPATGLLDTRVRFCVSASHTKEMLDYTLKVVEEEMAVCNIRRSQRHVTPKEIMY